MSGRSDARSPERSPDSVYLGVVGTSSPTPHLTALAEEVGRLAAERGAILLCGGLGGIMEAAARGAHAAGGLTVGILPEDRSSGNAYLDVALATGLGEMRNALLVRAADVLVAVGGGWGTLSEIAFAARTGVPVVGLETWSLTPPGASAAGERTADVELAASAAQAVDIAWARAAGRC